MQERNLCLHGKKSNAHKVCISNITELENQIETLKSKIFFFLIKEKISLIKENNTKRPVNIRIKATDYFKIFRLKVVNSSVSHRNF